MPRLGVEGWGGSVRAVEGQKLLRLSQQGPKPSNHLHAKQTGIFFLPPCPPLASSFLIPCSNSDVLGWKFLNERALHGGWVEPEE